VAEGVGREQRRSMKMVSVERPWMAEGKGSTVEECGGM